MFQLILLSALVALVAGRAPHVVPVVPMLDGRIIGGEDTTIKEFPYQLSLRFRSSHICGASVISAKKALTAAHCTDGFSPSFLSVRAGSTYREYGGTVGNVKSICQHPDYNPRTIDYDVSVLILNSPFPTSKVIKPILLVDIDDAPPVKSVSTVTGWGITSEGSEANRLQKVDVPRVDKGSCKAAYGSSSITDNMICFGYPLGGKDSCQGDSGGPLVYNRKQAGIVSWGFRCALPGYPGVYTNVAAATIHDHITQC